MFIDLLSNQQRDMAMGLEKVNLSWKDLGCVLLYLKPESGRQGFAIWGETVGAFRDVLKEKHPELVNEFNQLVECYYSPSQKKALEDAR